MCVLIIVEKVEWKASIPTDSVIKCRSRSSYLSESTSLCDYVISKTMILLRVLINAQRIIEDENTLKIRIRIAQDLKSQKRD